MKQYLMIISIIVVLILWYYSKMRALNACPPKPLTATIEKIFVGEWRCSGYDGKMERREYVCSDGTDYKWEIRTVEQGESCCETSRLLSIGGIDSIESCYDLTCETSPFGCSRGYACQPRYECKNNEWTYLGCAESGLKCQIPGNWEHILTLSEAVRPYDAGEITCPYDECNLGRSFTNCVPPLSQRGVVIEEDAVYPFGTTIKGETVSVCIGSCPPTYDFYWGTTECEHNFWRMQR